MSKYNPNIHHRRSIRLKGYDYAQEGLYFLTLCVHNRICLFGEVQNKQMKLNQFGKIVQDEWEKTPEIRKNVSLGEFMVMPNHFHAILQIDYQIKKNEENIGKFKSPSQTIGAIIRGFKGAATTRIKEIIRRERGEFKFSPSEEESRPSLRTGELQFAPTAATAAKKIDLKKSIWQRDYWDIIIRTDQAHQNISNYIINNPAKWEQDKFHR